jgi:hypothetical protein
VRQLQLVYLLCKQAPATEKSVLLMVLNSATIVVWMRHSIPFLLRAAAAGQTGSSDEAKSEWTAWT